MVWAVGMAKKALDCAALSLVAIAVQCAIVLVQAAVAERWRQNAYVFIFEERSQHRKPRSLLPVFTWVKL
ncbi:hypothetical protein [Variovorax gossypii]|uniref:hypothetical protein n=1 Tax=Variovorax gossypii TaxID=1679495 RepID=UPI001477270B|nr:hypothetical protein [Variovorax gossypii]